MSQFMHHAADIAIVLRCTAFTIAVFVVEGFTVEEFWHRTCTINRAIQNISYSTLYCPADMIFVIQSDGVTHLDRFYTPCGVIFISSENGFWRSSIGYIQSIYSTQSVITVSLYYFTRFPSIAQSIRVFGDLEDFSGKVIFRCSCHHLQ